jgi:hypothetical protein
MPSRCRKRKTWTGNAGRSSDAGKYQQKISETNQEEFGGHSKEPSHGLILAILLGHISIGTNFVVSDGEIVACDLPDSFYIKGMPVKITK